MRNRMVITGCVGFSLAVSSFAGAAAATTAARQPTLKERAAITAALPSGVRAKPVGCVWLDISVSARDRRFAVVRPTYLNATKPPCVRYAANGYFILKRLTAWKIIFNGSDMPACSLHVPRDLSPTCSS